MSKDRLSYSILVLAVISFIFGCAHMKESPKAEKTWIEEVEELAGGPIIAIDWSTHYPRGSKVQRYYVFILKNEIPEVRAIDISFEKNHVIESIKLPDDIDESDIVTYKQAEPQPIKMTKYGGKGWIGGDVSCAANCLAVCVNRHGFSGPFDECFGNCLDMMCKGLPPPEPLYSD